MTLTTRRGFHSRGRHPRVLAAMASAVLGPEAEGMQETRGGQAAAAEANDGARQRQICPQLCTRAQQRPQRTQQSWLCEPAEPRHGDRREGKGRSRPLDEITSQPDDAPGLWAAPGQ